MSDSIGLDVPPELRTWVLSGKDLSRVWMVPPRGTLRIPIDAAVLECCGIMNRVPTDHDPDRPEMQHSSVPRGTKVPFAVLKTIFEAELRRRATIQPEEVLFTPIDLVPSSSSTPGGVVGDSNGPTSRILVPEVVIKDQQERDAFMKNLFRGKEESAGATNQRERSPRRARAASSPGRNQRAGLSPAGASSSKIPEATTPAGSKKRKPDNCKKLRELLNKQARTGSVLELFMVRILGVGVGVATLLERRCTFFFGNEYETVEDYNQVGVGASCLPANRL